jgi:hypothetical protein
VVKVQDHPLKMTAVSIPIKKIQIDIFGKQTRPSINSARMVVALWTCGPMGLLVRANKLLTAPTLQLNVDP